MANIRIGPEVNVLPRSHLYRGYRPTYNIICSTYIVLVSAQQMNFLPENTSRNDTIFSKSISHILDHLAMLKFNPITVLYYCTIVIVLDTANTHLTSPMTWGYLALSASSSASMNSPTLIACSCKCSSSITHKVASAIAMETGLPPYCRICKYAIICMSAVCDINTSSVILPYLDNVRTYRFVLHI